MNLSLFSQNVSMATGMNRVERSVDCLVLCPNNHDRKVSIKSMTLLATTYCKENICALKNLKTKFAMTVYMNGVDIKKFRFTTVPKC